MTVGELREALENLPAQMPVCISFTDFENDGSAYATLDVRLGGVQDAAADTLSNLPADAPMCISATDLAHGGHACETRVVRRAAVPDTGEGDGRCFVLAAWGGI